MALAAPASASRRSPTARSPRSRTSRTATITTEEFDGALQQAAAAQGLKEVPPADDPQYELLRDAAISDLILARWVLGEAADRGIEVDRPRDRPSELDTVKEQQFGSEKAFEKFLEESGFSLDEAPPSGSSCS